MWQLWNAWDDAKPENEKYRKRKVEPTNQIYNNTHTSIIYTYLPYIYNIYVCFTKWLCKCCALYTFWQSVTSMHVCIYMCVGMIWLHSTLHLPFAADAMLYLQFKDTTHAQKHRLYWLHKCSYSKCIYNIYEFLWYSITCRFFSTIMQHRWRHAVLWFDSLRWVVSMH